MVTRWHTAIVIFGVALAAWFGSVLKSQTRALQWYVVVLLAGAAVIFTVAGLHRRWSAVGRASLSGLRYDEVARAWIVSSYRIGVQLLTSGSLTANYVPNLIALLPESIRSSSECARVRQFLSCQVLSLDGARHRTVHSCLQSVLSPAHISGVKAFIVECCERECKRIKARSGSTAAAAAGAAWDVAREVAEPIPLLVILQLFGVLPAADSCDDSKAPENETKSGETAMRVAARWKRWSECVELFFSCQTDTPLAAVMERYRACADAISECTAFVEAQIASRQSLAASGGESGSESGANVISELAAAVASGALLREELIPNLFFLIAAGHTTTASAIALTLHRMLVPAAENDTKATESDSDASRIADTVRRVSPVRRLYRCAARDISITAPATGSTPSLPVVQTGEWLVFHTDEMNADAAAGAVAADSTATAATAAAAVRQMTFGFGAHSCIGRALALTETELVVNTIRTHFPRLRFVDMSIDPAITSIATVKHLRVQSD